MDAKLLGGILLVVGTTIGAGMLALPVTTAEAGFWGSLVLLVCCWAIMSTCAFLFLEVNLWLPPNTNLISMAGVTLGKTGQGIAWLTYLLLLYSILSAYIAGGGDLFYYLLTNSGVPISMNAAFVLFTFLFGTIVYFGIRSVDYVNRGLMFGKLGAYFLLVLLIFPLVTGDNIANGQFKYFLAPNSVTVTVVSFSCLMIVPSLRHYFGSDLRSLKKAIFLGMLIPLLCYIAWDFVIMGVIPLDGSPGLIQIFKSNSNAQLVIALTVLAGKHSITVLAKFFTSICMATSFLSVSLCLSDFLSDGLSINKEGSKGIFVYALTFLPPIFIVLFYPDAFNRGLTYAGLSCFILMILFPPIMAWRGRYIQGLSTGYQVVGGKALLAFLIFFAFVMIGFGIHSVIYI